MIKAQPLEFVIGNVVRRVLHLIREEYKTITKMGSNPELRMSKLAHLCDGDGECVADSSMYNMLAHPNYDSPLDYSKDLVELIQTIPQGIQELMDEIDSSRSTIASQSLEHIHSNEYIMTLGRSETVEAFLLAAARKRQFQVIVAEAAPRCTGHLLARNLAEHGIETLLIPDAAIFAMMARVNKVIIGCHAVTANGGLIANSGAQIIASAAKHHSTPVCVLTPMYKLTPVFPENYDSFNLLTNPDDILPYENGDMNTEVVNPMYDYVQPQQVSLLLTNMYSINTFIHLCLEEDILLPMSTVSLVNYMIKKITNWINNNKLLEWDDMIYYHSVVMPHVVITRAHSTTSTLSWHDLTSRQIQP